MKSDQSNRSAKFWSEKNVFVTGASGLVGSWLTEALVDLGANVCILLRDSVARSLLTQSGTLERVNVVRAELEDYRSMERSFNEYEIDTVFHLGAQAIVGVAQRSPLATFESNIRGTYNLLEACRIHEKKIRRIVVASSDKAYGEQKRLPYTEDMTMDGRQPYEVSKSCTDLLAQSYFHSYGSPIGIVRCGNIYGGGDLNWNRIIPGTIRSYAQKQSPVIRSDGTYIRDYIYVKDVVSAYLAVGEALNQPKMKGEAFNFSSESRVSVLALVKEIQNLMGCQKIKPDIQNTASGEILKQYLSSAKARKMLGWKCQYTLRGGLSETIEWYQDFLSKNGVR